ncbi:MAG TPA: triose-phosphate isomerase [Gammaproteobacteria bacterium]|nr:triose-phosphate isomerase [Gammaproteobacteria bacterium]
MARKSLIAGNWKMNGSLGESRALVAALRAGVGSTSTAEMVLCPPYVYLSTVKEWLAGAPVRVGAQDLSDQVGKGAFTGEVAGAMLADAGCSHVIVGHSERRALYRESDEVVATKFRAAQSAGLVPILCVGETLAQREANRTQQTVARQVDAVLDEAGAAAFATAVIAYEPVWAIGTGRTATPEQAQEVHAFIRARVAARDATIARNLTIVYGGSVKGANARNLFAMDDIDGGLVGGASLVAAEFLEVFRAAT